MIYRIFVDVHLHASQHFLCLTIFYTTLLTEQLHSNYRKASRINKKEKEATGNLLENASNFTNDTLPCLNALLNCPISVGIRA